MKIYIDMSLKVLPKTFQLFQSPLFRDIVQVYGWQFLGLPEFLLDYSGRREAYLPVPPRVSRVPGTS